MSQHFLLSSRARTLSLATVFGMTDAEVEAAFRALRWAATAGAPVCPTCRSPDAYDCRRPNGAMRFRCRGCQRDFSVTSGTLFASHKRPLRTYLAAIAIFCNELKGKAMLAMSRDLNLSYKAAFVLCHKMREAMAAEMRGRLMGGVGKVAEVDGAYFGGYAKPANLKQKRIDRRLAQNLTGKRRVVIIIRERGGSCLPAVFRTEGGATRFLKSHIQPGTVVHADEAASWDRLHSKYKVKRINHGQAYSLNGACTNLAEGYFSRLRRSEAGHGHISGPYLLRYAQEAAFREDRRRITNGDLVRKLAELALTNKPSIDFAGYWQRHRAAHDPPVVAASPYAPAQVSI